MEGWAGVSQGWRGSDAKSERREGVVSSTSNPVYIGPLSDLFVTKYVFGICSSGGGVFEELSGELTMRCFRCLRSVRLYFSFVRSPLYQQADVAKNSRIEGPRILCAKAFNINAGLCCFAPPCQLVVDADRNTE